MFHLPQSRSSIARGAHALGLARGVASARNASGGDDEALRLGQALAGIADSYLAQYASCVLANEAAIVVGFELADFAAPELEAAIVVGAVFSLLPSLMLAIFTWRTNASCNRLLL